MCDLEDRKIHIRFGGARSGVDGRRNLQIISCSSSCNAAVLHEVLGSEEKGTKDAEEQESLRTSCQFWGVVLSVAFCGRMVMA